MNRLAPPLRNAFTMVEVFAVLMLILILIMLLLPAVQSSREAARRMSCANSLMQVGIGVQAYHSTFENLPTQLSGTDGSTKFGDDNDRRLSIFVALLPFLGQPETEAEIASALRRPSGWDEANDFGPGEQWMMSMADDGMEMEEASNNADESDSDSWPRGGPEPFVKAYAPWIMEVPVLRCPSDPGFGDPSMGRSNYAVCLGDAMKAGNSGPMKEVNGVFVLDESLLAETNAAMRGVFVPRTVMRLSDVLDGLSHTIMLGEINTDLGDNDIRTMPIAVNSPAELADDPSWARFNDRIDSSRSNFWRADALTTKLENDTGARRGFRWADGMPLYTSFNTILPPNREIVLSADQDDAWGLLPVSSRHQGGAHVAFADGSLRFISDTIDSGDSSQPTVYVGSATPPESQSPYGVWGAMGTRASSELSGIQ